MTSDIDEKFTLNMPLFRGDTVKVKFEVNVCLEVRNKGISIWLESVELKENIIEKTNEVLNAKVKEYRDQGITVIIR